VKAIHLVDLVNGAQIAIISVEAAGLLLAVGVSAINLLVEILLDADGEIVMIKGAGVSQTPLCVLMQKIHGMEEIALGPDLHVWSLVVAIVSFIQIKLYVHLHLIAGGKDLQLLVGARRKIAGILMEIKQGA
jgi:hypothetical protein